MRTEFTPVQLTDPDTAASEAELRRCVRCGFCNATCPTQVLLGDERDSPRGRIYLIKDMLENGRAPTAETVTHIDRCLSCLACVSTCPSGVNYTRLIDHARAYIEQRYDRPLFDRLRRRFLAWVMPSPMRLRLAMGLARLAKPFAPLFGNGPVRAMLALTPWRPARRAPAAEVYPSPKPPLARMALLQGCAEPALRPEIREATLRLLNRMGIEVVLAKDEVCCGSLSHHMGFEDDALSAARRNVDIWSTQNFDAIVVTVSGCGTTLKDYGWMLRNDPAYAERAAAVSARALDISEVIDRYGLPDITNPQALTVGYHSACSLQHGQQIKDLPAQLLERAGFTVRRPAEAHLCCGSAGTYNILQPVIAAQLKSRKLHHLDRLNPDVIAAGNIGCLIQLNRKETPVIHTVQLLDWATGGPNPLQTRNV